MCGRTTGSRPRRSPQADSTRTCSPRSSTARSPRSRWRPCATRPGSCRRTRVSPSRRPAPTASRRSASRGRPAAGCPGAARSRWSRASSATARRCRTTSAGASTSRSPPPSDYVAGCFAAYGLATDPTGRYAALWRPYHLIGLETTVSVLAAGLLGEPTGAPDALRADAVAIAKRDLEAGETLDGEGGFTVYGALVPASRSLRDRPVADRTCPRGRAEPRGRCGRPVSRDDVGASPRERSARAARRARGSRPTAVNGSRPASRLPRLDQPVAHPPHVDHERPIVDRGIQLAA